jgi:hypothetical protein
MTSKGQKKAMKDVVRYQAEDGEVFKTREAAETRDQSDKLRDALLVAAGKQPIGHELRRIGGRPNGADVFEEIADQIADHDIHMAARIVAAIIEPD